MARNKEKAWYLLPFLGIILLVGWSAPVETITVEDLEEKIKDLGSSRTCNVCNDGIDKKDCEKNVEKKTCLEYFREYLAISATPSDELKNFPKLENMKWKLKNENNTASPATPHKYTTSGFADLFPDKDKKMALSCVKQRIVVEKQDNPGAGLEIKDDNPRIIKYCSFHPLGKAPEGCKEVKQGHVTITTCNCFDKDNCNSASVLRVSHWIFAAFLLIIGAQIAMMK